MTPSHVELSQFEGLTPAQQRQLCQVLDDYFKGLEQGLPQCRDELIARYPDLAETLRAYLESLDFLQEAAAGFNAAPPADEPVEAAAQLASLYATGADAMADTSPSAGRQFGDFKIVREIGRGGMGLVYEAVQLSLDRRVALKVLPRGALLSSVQIARFRNEARAAAQLKHPHIVPVFAVGVERGTHYYAMQFIGGPALDRVISQLRELQKGRGVNLASGTIHDAKPQTAQKLWGDYSQDYAAYTREVARLGIQAAEALHAAHEVGILHRDIKPSNLLLDDEGKLWVADFGLARCRSDKHLTRTGDFVGTMGYMSPEQMRPRLEMVDQRSDVYSLGLTLYELLSLRHAIRANHLAEILREVERDDPYPLRLWNRQIPLDLETIVHKAMSKAREDRYGSADELAQDLRRFLEGRPTLARRPTFVDRAAKWGRRHKPFVTTAVGALALAVIGLTVSTMLLAQQKQRTEQALVASSDHFRHYRAQLALTNHHLALLQDQSGDPRQAAATLRSAQQLQRKILAEQPNDEPTLRDLAATLNNLSFLFAKSDAQQAERCFEEALQIHRRLAEAHPENSSDQAELALAHGNFGSFLARRGKTQHAIAEQGRAIALFEKLHANRPNAGSARDLAVSLNNLGMAQFALQQMTESEHSFQQARETLQSYVADDAPADDLGSLGGISNNLGMLQEQQRRLAEAGESYREAVKLQQAALRCAPQVVRHRDCLNRHYFNLARVLRELHQFSAAAETALARRDLWHGDAQQLKSVAEELAGVYAAQQNQGAPADDPASAARFARLAISVLEEAVDLGLPRAEISGSEALMVLSDDPQMQHWLNSHDKTP